MRRIFQKELDMILHWNLTLVEETGSKENPDRP